MDQERIAQLRTQVAQLGQQGRSWLSRIPVKARWALGLFLLAALFMALHTTFFAKNASLHLRVQHDFRGADLSVWVDGDLAYSGKLQGSVKKKFGLIPESVQGSLSQIVPVSSGTHQLRVRVVADDGSSQEDSISGDFASNAERELSVLARHRGVSLAWRGNSSTPQSSGSGWFSHYAGTLFLTIAGSIISALTGFVLKELPARSRAGDDPASKRQSASASL